MGFESSRGRVVVALLAVSCAAPEFGADASATGDAPSSGSVPTTGVGTSSSAVGAGGTGGSSTDSTSADAATSSTSSGEPLADCGNWLVEPGEQCEDGNAQPGDGCSAACMLEAQCGNGVVEPSELCDGGPGCGADCAPTAGSVCFDAQPLSFGVNQLGPGPLPITGFAPQECGSFQPSGIGWVELGDYPARIWARASEIQHRVAIRHGCDELLGCGRSLVTERLPAHSVVWVGNGRLTSPVPFSALEIEQVWEGFEFVETGEGFVTAASPPNWVCTAGSGIWQTVDTVGGLAVLESPPIDVRGLAPVLVRIRNTFVTPNPAMATARIEADIIGNVSTTVDLGEVAVAGELVNLDIDLVEAVGADAIRLRFLFDGSGNGASRWDLGAVLVSRSFSP